MASFVAKGVAQASTSGSTLTIAFTGMRQGATLLLSVAYETGSMETIDSDGGIVFSSGYGEGTGWGEVSRNSTSRRMAILQWGNYAGLADDSVVMTWSGPILCRAAVLEEVVGVSPSAPDVSATATGTSTSPTSGATAATAQANEFVFGAISTRGPVGDAAGTWGNSFTAVSRTGTSTGTPNDDITVATGYAVVSAIGAQTAAKTGITSRVWGAVCMTFKIHAPVTATLGLATATGSALPISQAFMATATRYNPHPLVGQVAPSVLVNPWTGAPLSVPVTTYLKSGTAAKMTPQSKYAVYAQISDFGWMFRPPV